MRPLYTLICCFLLTTGFAQEKYNLSLGANFVIDHRQEKIYAEGIVHLKNNVATITSGKIEGNFQGKPKTIKNDHLINGNKYWYKPALFASKNKLNFHCGEQVFTFTTNPIDVSSTKEIGFKTNFSGKGTIDKSDPADGKIWHDWVQVNHIIDGQFFYGETMHGIPDKFELQNIEVGDAQTFQIQIVMRNTGHDEWLTIEQIEITETPMMEIDLAAVVVVASNTNTEKKKVIACGFQTITHHCYTQLQKNNPTDEKLAIESKKKNTADSPTLLVFPNPTNNYLELKNAEEYDLNTIQILDATGRLINITNTYPLNVGGFAAGTYFVMVLEKESMKQVSTSFIVVQQ